LLFVPSLWCLKVQSWERFHCPQHGGALLNQSQRGCSSSTSFVVASWVVFLAETRWAPMLGAPKNQKESPNTEVQNSNHTSRKATKRRQGISEIMHSPQKLWIPLHVPSCPLL
jgi:hypothetical protein